jgi:CDP-glycerol glycerophosphotransferase
VLVTDYSSIMFDYANLDRPIVVYADDWDVYRATRGVYFDLLSGQPGDTPGPVARTEDELIAVFREGRWHEDDATALRAAFRARFCQFDDGHAAERVVRTLMLGQDATDAADTAQPSPPVSQRHDIPMKRGLITGVPPHAARPTPLSPDHN